MLEKFFLKWGLRYWKSQPIILKVDFISIEFFSLLTWSLKLSCTAGDESGNRKHNGSNKRHYCTHLHNVPTCWIIGLWIMGKCILQLITVPGRKMFLIFQIKIQGFKKKKKNELTWWAKQKHPITQKYWFLPIYE